MDILKKAEILREAFFAAREVERQAELALLEAQVRTRAFGLAHDECYARMRAENDRHEAEEAVA